MVIDVALIPIFGILERGVAILVLMNLSFHIVWKYSKCRIYFQFWHFRWFLSFWKTDLSGNTVRPEASGFQKTRQIDYLKLKM